MNSSTHSGIFVLPGQLTEQTLLFQLFLSLRPGLLRPLVPYWIPWLRWPIQFPQLLQFHLLCQQKHFSALPN